MEKRGQNLEFCKKVLLVVFLTTLFQVASGWNIHTYNSSNFFDEFTFFTADDPTLGYVNYVSRQEAERGGLINTRNNKVYIGADYTNVASGRGRNAIRITSNKAFNSGIFVLSLEHMPTGCGTWPAYWLSDWPNWPINGEVDIIEGVNRNAIDKTTLHSTEGCLQNDVPNSSFTGTWDNALNGQPGTNCYVNASGQYPNFGCGIWSDQGNFGKALNALGGGVYVTVWNDSGIMAYFFKHENLPLDIKENKPNPKNWGLPYANFIFGEECPSWHYRNMSIIINLTFCGVWAGVVFERDCPGVGTCNDFVKSTPARFKEAYWEINYLKVFV